MTASTPALADRSSIVWPSIPKYNILAQLYESERTVVYRAVCQESDRPVIIKMLCKTSPSSEDIVRFRNQAAIARLLNTPGVAKVYELSEYKQQPIIVTEDFAGSSLDRQLDIQSKLGIRAFLSTAVQLADILAAVHHQNIIHKDIKPQNILIHPRSGRVQLIDFSLSSQIPREQQGIHPPAALEGSLAYLAPEQTGRMNRGIDYRSDFYALGVTFYELLSGQLPFQEEEAIALIHCHIAKQPQPLRQITPEVPEMVAAIVDKLMAKNPEERYQSAVGLKHDLDRCLSAWKNNRNIPVFLLDKHNQAPPFIISESLYGRRKEVQILMNGFNAVAAGATKMISIAGASGIGKTAIIQEVHKPILEKRGYFISGKFDQLNRNRPFSAVIEAFERLIEQIIEAGEAEIEIWKNKILSALDGQGQVIVDFLPSLEQIISEQSAAAALSGTAAENRFNQVFQQFIQVFSQPDRPLVLFLDDLQWADLASLQLLEKLAIQSHGYLLLLGAYRDNEVFPAHPLQQMIDTLHKKQAGPEHIMLSPLAPDTLNQLTADTLRCSLQQALGLTQLIYSKTQGNPFFTAQYLKSLQKDGWITFQSDTQCWQYDLEAIAQTTLTDDVVALMLQQLRQLSEPAQNALKLAACVGNTFDLNTLSVICGKSHYEAAAALWETIQAGMILPVNDAYKFYRLHDSTGLSAQLFAEPTDNRVKLIPTYRFLHDRVQQAAYALIPAQDKQQTHTAIGQLLLNELTDSEQDEQLFEVMNHLNQGDLQNISDFEKLTLAQLNLRAGTKALRSAAAKAAYHYYQIGIGLLPKTAWQTYYPLAYKLHRQKAEAAYLSAQYDQAEALYSHILPHCQTPLDRASIYRIQMTQYELQGRHTEAIACQKQSLSLLGWPVPSTEEALTLELSAEIDKVNDYLKTQAVETRLQAAHLDDPKLEEMLRILQILFYSAWLDGQPVLALLAVAKMTTISWKYGNSEMSPFGYTCYGMVLCAWCQDYESGYRFGKMGVQLCDQFDNADVRSMTNFVFGSDVQSWSRPLREADTYYETAYRYGMEAGNWLTVSFMMILSGSDRLTYGQNLYELYQTVQPHVDFLERIQSIGSLEIFIASVVQPIRQLRGLTVDETSLDDDTFCEADFLAKYRSDNYALAWLYAVKVRHAVLFQNEAAYPQLLDKFALVEATIATHAKVPSTAFYTALMHLQLKEQTEQDEEKHQHSQAIAALETKLQGWAQSCRENIEHKCLILAGEKARLAKQWAIASEKYDEAIALATRHGYHYEAAFANELAAQLFFAWEKPRIAQEYLVESYLSYERWGAIAKLNQLKKQHPGVFDARLDRNHSIKSSTVRNTPKPTSIHLSRTGHSQTLSDSAYSLHSNPQSLDTISLLKASQALSSEVHLDQLITVLLRIALENAGANRCALLLLEGEDLQVKAIAQNNSSFEIKHLTAELAAEQEISLNIVQTVQQTLETTIIGNASTERSLETDPYVVQYQPKSILCFPIQQSGRLLGVLYLENRHTANAFTPNHLEVLRIITAQAAISIENSLLYERQEALVQSRTQALRQALEDLRTRQMQLIQKEKMSSLGQLVSGVAHEINNPINFIYGNISSANSYFQDFTDLLDSYQKNYPEPAAEVAELREEIDVNFIIEDLEKTLASMKLGAGRIRDIVLSLRNFSRLDEAEFKPVDIHEGIESTLMLVQHRLKEVDSDWRIEINRQYEKLPKITCFAGEINQVLFNILNNAIDAIAARFQIGPVEAKLVETASAETAPTEQPCIHIQSEQTDDGHILVRISDNGAGIAPHILDKIFDPFFTTKPVGQGTGMGLAIAHQTIIQKHQGDLAVTSEVGKGSTFSIKLPIHPKTA